MFSSYKNISSSKGFSLIEMAVVMLIMGSLLSGLLVALTQTSESTRRTTAKNQLLKIEEALYSYAQANGRLPCPATSATDGFEGDCTQIHGFVPNATLSLYSRVNDDGLMLDPWANPYRYSVASYEVDGNGKWIDSGNGTLAFTDISALKLLFEANSSLDTSGPDIGGESAEDHLLWVCDINDCSGDIYTQITPAIVFSMGKNWTDMSADCIAGTNDDETANAGGAQDGDYCIKVIAQPNVFVETEYHEDDFDDIILWLSPYVLFGRMIEATQLP